MKPDTIILTQQSFDKLFRLYQRKLYAVAYSLVHDANTAEDIVHDSFMTIWENRETVQFTSIEAYLFGVVKKRCLKYRRDRYTGKAVYEKILMKERGVMDAITAADALRFLYPHDRKLQSERIIPAGNHRDMPQTTGTNAGIDQTGIHSS